MHGIIAVHQNNKLKLKRCQKIWTFLNHYLFNSKGGNYNFFKQQIVKSMQRSGTEQSELKSSFLCLNDVFLSSDVLNSQLTQKCYELTIDFLAITKKVVLAISSISLYKFKIHSNDAQLSCVWRSGKYWYIFVATK